MLLQLITLLALAGGPSATITLPAEARARGTELGVSEIAKVDCVDAATKARIERHTLGWSPAPGYSRLLQRLQVERELTSAFPGVAIRVSGADACRVTPLTQVVTASAIETKARAELATLFEGRESTVRLASPLADLELPEAREKTELVARIERRELRGGAWSVPVQLWIDGAVYQTAWASFAVELWADVPVLVRAVARGELLSAADVELRRSRVDAGTPEDALDGVALAGAVAQRDLARGSIVAARDVKRAQLVTRGEPVTLEVQKGAVVARSTVTCSQDGALGDSIQVQTADKSRSLRARVVGRSLVRIEL